MVQEDHSEEFQEKVNIMKKYLSGDISEEKARQMMEESDISDEYDWEYIKERAELQLEMKDNDLSEDKMETLFEDEEEE